MKFDRRMVLTGALMIPLLNGRGAAAQCIVREAVGGDEALALCGVLASLGSELHDPVLLLAAARAQLWSGKDADTEIIDAGLKLVTPAGPLAAAFRYAGTRVPTKSLNSMNGNDLHPGEAETFPIASHGPARQFQLLVFIDEPGPIERDSVRRKGQSIIEIRMTGIRAPDPPEKFTAGSIERSGVVMGDHPQIHIRNIFQRPIRIRVVQQ